MLVLQKAYNMSIDDLNEEINNLQSNIENYSNLSLKEQKQIDIEPLRQWSNELYALNSIRLQKVSNLNSSLQKS
jgi:hypothetical protein